MENGPGLKMYFLSKMGIFHLSLCDRLPETTCLLGQGISRHGDLLCMHQAIFPLKVGEMGWAPSTSPAVGWLWSDWHSSCGAFDEESTWTFGGRFFLVEWNHKLPLSGSLGDFVAYQILSWLSWQSRSFGTSTRWSWQAARLIKAKQLCRRWKLRQGFGTRKLHQNVSVSRSHFLQSPYHWFWRVECFFFGRLETDLNIPSSKTYMKPWSLEDFLGAFSRFKNSKGTKSPFARWERDNKNMSP